MITIEYQLVCLFQGFMNFRSSKSSTIYRSYRFYSLGMCSHTNIIGYRTRQAHEYMVTLCIVFCITCHASEHIKRTSFPLLVGDPYESLPDTDFPKYFFMNHIISIFKARLIRSNTIKSTLSVMLMMTQDISSFRFLPISLETVRFLMSLIDGAG